MLRYVSCLVLLLPTLCFARPLVVAHRGASYDAPENTLVAYKEAERQGAEGWEIDIYLTADGRLMLMHDKDTSRTTDGNRVMAKTKSEALRKLDAGSWKDPKYAGEKIPFLEEIFEALPKGVRLFIEIKSPYETMLALEKMLKNHPKLDQVTVICFALETCILAKQRYPNVPVYWLIGANKNSAGDPVPFGEEIIEIAKKAGVDGLDLNYQGITKELVAKAKEAGLEVHAWTVDEPADATRMAEMGVLSITTNRPQLIKETLEKK